MMMVKILNSLMGVALHPDMGTIFFVTGVGQRQAHRVWNRVDFHKLVPSRAVPVTVLKHHSPVSYLAMNRVNACTVGGEGTKVPKAFETVRDSRAAVSLGPKSKDADLPNMMASWNPSGFCVCAQKGLGQHDIRKGGIEAVLLGDPASFHFGASGDCLPVIRHTGDITTIQNDFRALNLNGGFLGANCKFLLCFGGLLSRLGVTQYLEYLKKLIEKIDFSLKKVMGGKPYSIHIVPPFSALGDEEGAREFARLYFVMKFVQSKKLNNSGLLEFFAIDDFMAKYKWIPEGGSEKMSMGAGVVFPIWNELDVSRPYHFERTAKIDSIKCLDFQGGDYLRHEIDWCINICENIGSSFKGPSKLSIKAGQLAGYCDFHTESNSQKFTSLIVWAEELSKVPRYRHLSLAFKGQTHPKVLYIGESHANLLAKTKDHFPALGNEPNTVFRPNEISGVLGNDYDGPLDKEGLINRIGDTEIVVYWVSPNSLIVDQDGELKPPVKGADGRFHFSSDNTIASEARIKEFVKGVTDLVDAVNDLLVSEPHIYVVGPFPRHLTLCCISSSHMSGVRPGKFLNEIDRINGYLLGRFKAMGDNITFIHPRMVIGNEFCHASVLSHDGVYVKPSVTEMVKQIISGIQCGHLERPVIADEFIVPADVEYPEFVANYVGEDLVPVDLPHPPRDSHQWTHVGRHGTKRSAYDQNSVSSGQGNRGGKRGGGKRSRRGH